MAGEHLKVMSRRVVTGLDDDGRSTIVADSPTPVRVATPGFTVCDIWRVDSLPLALPAADATTGEVVLDPPEAGFVYRVTTFPPDSEWDARAEWASSLQEMSGEGALVGDGDEDPDGPIGLHQTDTVDIVTIISGELVAITESAETVLRPGDSLVQNGTVHTWANRGDVPCMKVAVQIGATR